MKVESEVRLDSKEVSMIRMMCRSAVKERKKHRAQRIPGIGAWLLGD